MPFARAMRRSTTKHTAIFTSKIRSECPGCVARYSCGLLCTTKHHRIAYLHVIFLVASLATQKKTKIRVLLTSTLSSSAFFAAQSSISLVRTAIRSSDMSTFRFSPISSTCNPFVHSRADAAEPNHVESETPPVKTRRKRNSPRLTQLNEKKRVTNNTKGVSPPMPGRTR